VSGERINNGKDVEFMHLFISAGEPSGDMHGANLIKAFRRIDPNMRISGFGGDRMKAAGCDLLHPLARMAIMGFYRVLLSIFAFMRLQKKARRFLQDQKPDALILIDFPGFHWNLAKSAHELGIPVYYFVPPQIWAWRSGRVKKMKRWVDHVLSALPFEHEWFKEHGVKTTYIGHPYFDELSAQKLDPHFMESEKRRGGRVVAILPGSRMGEVTKNLSAMLDTAAIINAKLPETRFLVASFNEVQAEVARGLVAGRGFPVDVHVGRTPEIIELAEACVSVSGSVSLEMMYHLKPATIIYRVSKATGLILRMFVHVKFITLVNLLADRVLYPEIPTTGDPSAWLAEHMLGWLENPLKAAELRHALAVLKEAVARPGACDRAAQLIFEEIGWKKEPKRAA
jgi:lipid-A-disaccharide synthase